MLEKEKIVQAFSTWGFEELGKAGNQHYGNCVFCGNENKFYINQENALWDCKVCGMSGNYMKFLNRISERNQKIIKDKHYQILSSDRGLPEIAFRKHGIGVWGKTFSIPILDEEGRLKDLRRFRPGKKMMASLGCSTGLWGAERLKKADKSQPVYVCEGEWDGMALYWLLRSLSKAGVVVAVPGANTFKNEWVPLFEGRIVYACYDNDEAGDLGDVTIEKKLTGTARKIHHLHWSANLPSGFDVRDLIRFEAIKKRKPKRTYKTLMQSFKDESRRPKAIEGEVKVDEKSAVSVKLVKTNVEKVYKAFKKYLFLRNTDGIQIMLATVIANKIGGDPVWMFLVAPPGSAKTELIQSLSQCEQVYPVSSLTPHSLISGATWTGGADPSLIPKLDQKMLAIKDFTTIMEMRENEREEIFGILRDSYDGSCVKIFGNGVKRVYESRFGVIAGVTPVIYHLDSQNQSLGERFLKFSIEENLRHRAEDDVISRSISNIHFETEMRANIAKVVAQFINWKCAEFDRAKIKLPSMTEQRKLRLIAFAKFCARMRGSVSRDKYRTDMVQSRPSSEIGSRVGKQLSKCAQALALLNDRDHINDDDLRLVRKIMLDTISQKLEDIVHCIYDLCETENDSVTTRTISAKTRYPQSTVSRCLGDLFMLEIVQRNGRLNKYEWSLTPYIRDLIETARIYKRKTT